MPTQWRDKMTNWHDFFQRQGTAPSWPYAVDYEKEHEIDTDVLVIGGGIAGCWAAISAARKGVRVALVEKGDTIQKRLRRAGLRSLVPVSSQSTFQSRPR